MRDRRLGQATVLTGGFARQLFVGFGATGGLRLALFRRQRRKTALLPVNMELAPSVYWRRGLFAERTRSGGKLPRNPPIQNRNQFRQQC
jgi:hypothetical protein